MDCRLGIGPARRFAGNLDEACLLHDPGHLGCQRLPFVKLDERALDQGLFDLLEEALPTPEYFGLEPLDVDLQQAGPVDMIGKLDVQGRDGDLSGPDGRGTREFRYLALADRE